jgi:hypothetical protein
MEVWAAAAVGIYSARKASKSAKAQSEFEAMTNKEMVPIQGYEQRRTLQFENDLIKRSLQEERARRAKAYDLMGQQRGLASPGYTPVAVEVPDMPVNPVPNDEVYQRTSGLSNAPTTGRG